MTYHEATKQLLARADQFIHANEKLADACRRYINSDNDTERLNAISDMQAAQRDLLVINN